MRGLHKIFIMLMSALLLTGITAMADFSDVSDDLWSYEYITQTENLGYVHGYEDGTFRPEENMTNAEFITAAVQFSGKICDDSENSYMNYAREQGYVLDGEMTDADANVTRQSIAKVISRIVGGDAVDEQEIAENIVDWDSTCPKCKSDIAKCYKYGIMSGYPDGTFRGRYSATRAEVAAILVNADNYRKDNL